MENNILELKFILELNFILKDFWSKREFLFKRLWNFGKIILNEIKWLLIYYDFFVKDWIYIID